MTALRRAAARGVARLSVALLSLAMLLASVAVVAGPAAVARAADPLQHVRIDLTHITPDSLSKDATLTVRGRVTNTSGKPIGWMSIALWRDRYPITNADDLTWVLNAPPESPAGSRMASEGAYVNLNDDAHPTVAAGQSADFVLRAKVADLGLVNAADGTVHLLGVHVRGIPTGGENQTLARVRFVMPWQTTGRAISPVVLLDSAPALAIDGRLTDDHLARELRGGRLERLLQAAELPGATTVVDPALFDAVTTMADGYVLGKGEKVPATDPRALAAANWSARLQHLIDNDLVLRTPWGNPDPALLAGDQAVRERALAAMPDDHALGTLPLAIWPRRGGLSAAARHTLAAFKPSMWLEESTTSARHTLTDRSEWVRALDGALDGGPGPDPRTSLPQRQGRLLAHLALHRGTTVVPVTDDASARVLLGLPSWVGTRPLDSLPLTPAPTPTAGPTSTLAAPLARAIDENTTAILNWTDLLGDDEGGPRMAAQVGTAALNPAFTATSAHTWLRDATASVPAQYGAGVSLSMAPSFVMGDRTTTLPITVRNGTSHPVRVKVVMTSDNAARITIPDTRLVTIRPGEAATVNFRPRATTNGVVGFTAQLQTQRGVSIGQPRRFSVNATSFGRVAWIIIIASGAVLLGGTALRIRQVQRDRAQQPPPAETSSRADITSRPHP